jgi:hypothetical protein
MRLHGWLVAFTLVCAGLGLGQTPAAYSGKPSLDQIARWLTAGTAQDRAWGAYYVVQRRDRTLLQTLEGLAQQWQPLPAGSAVEWPQQESVPQLRQREIDNRDAMTAVLDGVIILNGSLPVDALIRLAGTFPVQTGVLLARLPREEIEPALLSLYRDAAPPNSLQQRIAAEMLAEQPTPGFAASLLKGATLSGAVHVFTPGGLTSNDPTGGMGGRGEWADPEWPTVGQYSLISYLPKPDTIAFPIAPGLRGAYPILALRAEGARTWSSAMEGGLTVQGRLVIIAKMLGVDAATLPIRARETVYIPAQNSVEYQQKFPTFISGFERRSRQLDALLEAKNLITAEEVKDADAQPKLVLSLWDERGEDGRDFELPPAYTRRPAH